MAWRSRSSRQVRWPRNWRCTSATCGAVSLGATLVGFLFVLPSFLMVWALSVAYVRFGGLPWMQALFYGIGAAVIGIIARSAHKLTRLTLGTSVQCSGLIFAAMAADDGVDRAGDRVAVPARWRADRRARRSGGPTRAVGAGPAAGRAVCWPLRCRRPRRRPGADAHEHLLGLRQGRGVRLRQRPGDRAVPVRRAGAERRVAERSAVPRRRGGRDDHAGAGRHHGRVHRLPGRRALGHDRRGARRLPAGLPLRRHPGAVLSVVIARSRWSKPSWRASRRQPPARSRARPTCS